MASIVLAGLGLFLILIPDPATTAAGILILLVSLGIKDEGDA